MPEAADVADGLRYARCMPTAVLIGANRGLGLGFARYLLQAGYELHATVRDPENCSDLRALAEQPAPSGGGQGSLNIYALEVACADSRRNFVDQLGLGQIDLLIHNAGIYGPSRVTMGSMDEDTWKQVLWVDTVAPLMCVQELLPKIRAASNAKIALLTSRVGSIADNQSGAGYFYRSAKAGLNAAGRSLALDLAPEGISVLLLHPGWVKTDMGGDNAPLEIPESIDGMMEQIDLLSVENSGRFVDWSGTELPW